MARKMLGAVLRLLRAPNDNAKAFEFAGLYMQIEMLTLVGRPIPPELQQRYDKLLKWYIRYTGQLPPHN